MRKKLQLDTGASSAPALFPGAFEKSVPPLPHVKQIRYGPEVCQKLTEASAKEWIVTNGIGGYASSSILGMNTRRTHGLLVAAAHPPVGRVAILSAVDETIVLPTGRTELATHRYGNVIHPEGYRSLVEFRLDPCPTFLYKVADVLLEKTVFLLPGENSVVVGYTLRAGSSPIELALRPLIAVRDFRWVSEENTDFNARIEEKPGVLVVRPYFGMPSVVIHHGAELVDRAPLWYKNFEYVMEKEGTKRVFEDLWSPGQMRYLLRVGESASLVVSTGRQGGTDLVFHARRLENTQQLLARSLVPPGEGPLAARLSWTAENFLARRPVVPSGGRSDAEAFLLAGFPGAAPWGRDAVVALPGLMLATGRIEAARDILLTLASKMKWGLLPVRFSEEDGSPEYDSADTSLWFFWAVWHYWKTTRDLQFIFKKLFNPMREILDTYLEGTTYGIGMDEDGLILLSDEELPLTWMDAREPGLKEDVPGRAVTPRWGKTIEINALWFCALSVMGQLSERLNLRRAGSYLKMSRLVEQSFQRVFKGSDGIFFDRVAGMVRDPAVRPNMLIAASLPFSPISRKEAGPLLKIVEEELLTPFGLRTLSPKHPNYHGEWTGDLKQRAHAYHQGTVWSWLVGPYVSALIRVHRLTRGTQEAIRRQLLPFLGHLEQRGLGSVSELFDADAPHTPRGGISQAWAVGEILRAIHEAKLVDL